MNIEEANRVIAEYMGGPYSGDFCQSETERDLRDDTNTELYCTKAILCNKCYELEGNCYLSLDALVPVWEKLGVYPKFYSAGMGDIGCSFDNDEDFSGKLWSEGTIQEAACIATAKAILQLREK